jgi:hypothetical protein
MLMAEIFSPKCPWYAGINPIFIRDANAKVEGIKYPKKDANAYAKFESKI